MKKIVLSFLAVFYLLFSSSGSVLAQGTPSGNTGVGPWYNQSFPQWATKVFEKSNPTEIFGERYTYAQVTWILHSLEAVIIATIAGPNAINCVVGVNSADLGTIIKCATGLIQPPSGGSTSNMSGGANVGLAYLTNSLLNTRPASGVQYVKDKASSLHIVPYAQAQQTGVGFGTLQPVQVLWTAVRNISYSLMVVVIIVMAFMIMFRVKISPQTVISVQSALPKIAAALILITFSYAIAGFLVDLMYVVVGAFSALIKVNGSTISSGTVTYLFTQLTSGNGLASIVVGLILFAILLFGVGFAAGSVGAISSITFLGIGAPLLIGGILLLFVAIMILVILIRLFWLMVQTAAETVILIIVGPLMILAGTLSSSGGFGNWFRTVAANLAVYPTVIVMIFLSHYFFWGWFMGGILGGGLAAFGPCGATGASLNTFCISPVGFGSVNLPGMPIGTTILGFFLSFVILFLIPRAAHIIEATIEGKKFDFAGGAREAVNPFGIGTFLAGAATGGVSRYIGEQVNVRLGRRFSTANPPEKSAGEAVERAGRGPTAQ